MSDYVCFDAFNKFIAARAPAIHRYVCDFAHFSVTQNDVIPKQVYNNNDYI